MTSRCSTAARSSEGLAGSVLTSLTAAQFVAGVGALVAVGLAAPAASLSGFGATAIGGAVAAFALAATLGQALLARLPPRSVLVGGLLLLGLGAAVHALASAHGLRIAAHLAMGLGAGLSVPTASAITAERTPAARRGRALGLVFSGLTVATLVVMPFEACLGAILPPHGAFLLIAGAAILAAMAAIGVIPPTEGLPAPGGAPRALAAVLRLRPVAFGVLATLLQVAAQFAAYPLLADLLARRSGAEAGATIAALLAGGAAGSALVARSADRIAAIHIVPLSIAAALAPYLALALAPHAQGPALLAIVAWSAVGLMLQAPRQRRLATVAGARTPLAFGLNAAAICLGMAGGAALGRAAWELLAFGALLPLSLALAAAAGLAAAAELAAEVALVPEPALAGGGPERA